MRAQLFATTLLIALSALGNQAGAAVGRTEGTFDVSADGAATYTIPIWVPPGPRGMQPSLALTYNSLGRNGPLGVGWSLAGLSSIERCRRAYPIDIDTSPVTMNNQDRYCMGINRLRLTGGTYGTANSTYAKEVDDFSVITASSTLQGAGPQSFTVVDKNGLTYEYGTSPTARVTFVTNGTVLRWMLNKVSDRDGNSYTIDYAVSDGVAEPTTISWSPTAPSGSSYRYTAVLTYSDKTQNKDWLTWYIAGNPVTSKKRLDAISIRHMGSTVRKYILTYNAGPLTGLSRLSSIKECADEAASNCLQPTLMTYQAGRAPSSSARTVGVASGATIVGAADFDGDRKHDLVLTIGGSSWYVAFGNSDGFGAPVPVPGLTGTFGQTVDYDNFFPGDRAAFIANLSGTLHTFSATGRSFPGGVSTGIAHPAGHVPTGIGARGTLMWIAPETSTQTNRVNMRNNLTPAGAANPVFSSSISGQGNSIPRNVTALGTSYTVRLGAAQIFTDRGLERRDLDGDAFADFYATIGLDYCSGSQCYPHQTVVALFRYGGLEVDPSETWTIYDGGLPPAPILFNDDQCSDVPNAAISACSRSTGPTLTPPAPGFWIDWDGDGRTDLAANNGGNIGIYASTGSSFTSVIPTGIPYASDYRVLDIDGDGLDDLARVDGATIRYYMREPTLSYLTQMPDLLASIVDGNGISHSVDYASTAHSNYQVGTAIDSTVRARVVVARTRSPDGIGDTYTRTYTYIGAREDKTRDTFLGFEERRVEDSRHTGLVFKTHYRQEFPRTGWVWKTEVLRDGSSPLTLNQVTDAVQTLDGTNFRQRYFPYVERTKHETYEPSGSQLIARQETAFSDFDFATGNARTVTTTLTDGGSERWTSTLTTQYEPAVSRCLDLPQQITQILTRVVPARPSITRTLTFTKDGSSCRHRTQTIVGNSPNYSVTTTYEYDAFGNINSTSVSALEPSLANPNAYQAMAARQELVDWGPYGVAPETITNALNQATSIEYHPSTGLLRDITDPNGLVTSFAFDGFGRITKQTRPDGTSTALSYEGCAAGGGCLSGSQHLTTVVQQDRDVNQGTIATSYTYLDRVDRTLVTRTPLVNGNYQWAELQYDRLGRVARTSIPCATSSATVRCVIGWTKYPEYDLLGRIKRIEQPANEQDLTRDLVTTIAYTGLTTSITDPLYRTSSTVRDVTGNVLRSTDANGYHQEFSYDSANSLVEVRETVQPGRNPVLFAASYDYGIGAFQRTISDRALGVRTRWYDGFGQLRRWRDGKNQEFFAEYDPLSRIVSRQEPDMQTSWEYGANPAEFNIGKLRSATSISAASEIYKEEYFYDSAGRLRQQAVQLPGEVTPYRYDLAYDPATGFLDRLTYPASTSGYRLALKYNFASGILRSIADVNNASSVFWTLNDTAGGLNAFGQITHDRLGSGIQRERIYDLVTGDLEKITAGPSGNPMLLQNASIGYDDMGNVQQRQNNLGSLPASLTENFAYGDATDQDYLDRLTKVYRDDGNGAVQTLDIDYDAFGNIDYRIDASSAAIPVDMSISWTSYNYPRTISAPSVGESASFAYGPDRQRWRMVYQAGSTSETTYYLGGLMEKVVKAGVAEYRHYIPGAEEIIGLYSRASSGTNVLRYLLTDHQGSIEAITDSAGSNPIYSSFTALGVHRDPIDWSGSPSSTHDAITRQGYTFQTVLGRMGLNHMNGRVHDAISGTFLSPDPYIPDPLNTQAFNRYAYVYNNPMTYTDPSGFSPDGPSCVIMFFCAHPPIIDPGFLIPDEYRDVVRMCLMGWCPLNYERSLSPDKAAATINPGPDRRGTGKISDATDTVRRVMLPYTAALQDRGVQGTWGDYAIGFLKGGYNIAQQTAAASNPIVALISPPHQLDIADNQLAGAATMEFGSMILLPSTIVRSVAQRLAGSGQRVLAGLCFAPGTIVQTENGPKRIEDVQVGEKVWSWEEASGEIVLSGVVETFVRADQPLLAVTIGAASTAQETIKSTTEHPYWTQRGWTPARELTTADQVLSRSGEWLSVLSVTELAETSTVYNFEVKGSHSYFVGEQGVLVHNVSKANPVTRLFHGSDARSASAIVNDGISRAAAKELGGGDIFWATSDKGIAGFFARANPAGEQPSIVAFDIPTSTLQSLIKSGAIALDRTGAYMIKNWKAFNEAVTRRAIVE